MVVLVELPVASPQSILVQPASKKSSLAAVDGAGCDAAQVLVSKPADFFEQGGVGEFEVLL